MSSLTSRKGDGKSYDKSKNFKNKTWKRKADDGKSFTKKELNVLIQKAEKQAYKKAKAELNAMNKESSDDDDGSILMLEEATKKVDKMLADFDFKDNDEISV